MTQKEKVEAYEREQLKARLIDFWYGAAGDNYYDDPEDEAFPGFESACGLDAFGRFVGAIKKQLLKETQAYLVEPNGLENFTNLERLIEYLRRNEVKAWG